MPIDKDRWEAAGEALEALFKSPRNKQFCTILRDLLIDARNRIEELDREQNRLKPFEGLYQETKRDLDYNREGHEAVKTEVEVRKRIQHELRAIILLAINPE